MAAAATPRADLLWYTRPAGNWHEAMPLGNGRIGAMVFGDPTRDRVALNHEWLWRGLGRGRDVEDVAHRLPEIRKLFFDGETLKAGQLANEVLGGPGGVLADSQPHAVDAYQPAGDLWISTDHEGELGNYQRELDLNTAISSISFTHGKSMHNRSCCVHSSKPMLLMHMAAMHNTPVGVTVGVGRIDDVDCTITPVNKADLFGFTGEFNEGIRFAVLVHLMTDAEREIGPAMLDGCVAAARVKTAHLLLRLTINVEVDGADPLPEAEAVLQKSSASWKELRASHVADHQMMYQRTSVSVPGGRTELPTDERVDAMRAGEIDPGLIALTANYARYLLISSARANGLPPNLQGIWNEQLQPPWGSDIHQDVNVQMNYWPAETADLSECVEALMAHCERMIPHGREVAKKLYGCSGAYAPLTSDAWARCTPDSRGWDVWVGAGAWLAQHFWWRWLYSGDRKLLAQRVYPYHKLIAAFYADYLVEDPRSGHLVPVPSQSPENRFEGGTAPVSLCVGATSDIMMIREVLSHAVAAARTLNVDAELAAKWERIIERLPLPRIGKHGQLQEWLEDYDEVEPGHRHYSHLYALYPGDQITVEHEPQLAAAARTSLERRLAAGGGHTGWSRAWTACLWARLGEGDHAIEHLAELIREFATPTLLDLHPPGIFQIDGNFGFAAGFFEMLVQSHRGMLRLWPAMAWDVLPFGHVTGLRTQGGASVTLEWDDGKPAAAIITTSRGGPMVLGAPGIASAELAERGKESVATTEVDDNCIRFEAAARSFYHITWS